MNPLVRQNAGRNGCSVLLRPYLVGVAALLCATTIFVIGCSSGPSLYPVRGEVTFDGTLIETGYILFRKVEGDQRGFAGEIKNGHYKLLTEAGVMTVEITGSRPIPGKFDYPLGKDGPAIQVGEMYVPAQYNTKTTLTAEVAASGGNEIPFDLSSK